MHLRFAIFITLFPLAVGCGGDDLVTRTDDSSSFGEAPTAGSGGGSGFGSERSAFAPEVTAACPSEAAACDADSNCIGLLDCIHPCESQACVDDCVAKTSNASVERLASLIDCAERASGAQDQDQGGGSGGSSGGGSSGDSTEAMCLEQQCAQEINACTTSCQNLLRCAQGCADSQSCVDDCANQYPTGIQPLQALIQCFNARCDS